MNIPHVKLYYKNVMMDVIGKEHGIRDDEFEDLSLQTVPLITQLNTEKNEGETPYRNLPKQVEVSKRIKKLVAEVQPDCETLVVFGIGGSALGNLAIQTALNPYMYNIDKKQRRGYPQLFVFDNIDPEQLVSFFDWLGADRLKNTFFNVISKSGRTSETAAQFLYTRKLLMDRLGPNACRKQIIATTDENQGMLRTIVREEGYRSLIVPDGVGGRFSVLSEVGLFSAAMCGIDIDLILAGARDMDERVSCEDFWENPAAINAAINYHYYTHGKPISVMMPYSYALKDFVDWYRQLWAESLGKYRDLSDNKVQIGPTPVRALGTTDQHSQVQLYREGPNDKLFTFLEVKDFDSDIIISPPPDCAPELSFLATKKMSILFNKEKKATEYALIESNRPNLTVVFDRINAYTVGQFIYLYEVTTSITGALYGINPYDQPAVELGKEATFALMGKEGYEHLTQEIQSKTEFDEDFLV